MRKLLLFVNPVVTLAIVGLVLGSGCNVNAMSRDDNNRLKNVVAQNLNCPSLDEALIPVEHPVHIRLNQKFRAERQSVEINNVVRVGNYGAAYLWNQDSNGRVTSATPVAIQFRGDNFNQAVIVTSHLPNILESWGASPNTAKCVLLLLDQSGI